MKANGGVELQLHVLLTSPLDGVELSVSRTDHFTPTGRARDDHWIEDRWA